MKWPWSVTAKGFAMGMADLVPGVSGGTVAFIAGIYDPLLNSLSALSGDGLRAILKGDLRGAWVAVNGPFLFALALGIGAAIVTLASPLHWLLEHEPTLLRAFFVGLVATSVPLVGKHVGGWGLDAWVWAATGCAVAGFITSLPPLVQSAHPAFLVAAGMLAICAMLLPGISGSFLLLILGAYAPVLLAVKSLDVTKIAAFGAGAVLGLLAFSRVLKWLLEAKRRPTLAILTGFLVGSLQALWPWKAEVRPLYTHSDGRVEWLLENVAPETLSAEVASVVGLAVLGGAVVWGLHRLGDARGMKASA
jgi:putative membrane protein